MQQLPPAICTAPVNETGAVTETSTCGIGVGVSEAVGVIGWLDASVIGTTVSGAVGLAA